MPSSHVEGMHKAPTVDDRRRRRDAQYHSSAIPNPQFYNIVRYAYFSFFALAPLTFAVPRRVFCRFLRCLPVGLLVVIGDKSLKKKTAAITVTIG